MAAYFAADGWDDITVAFPLNILEIDRIRALASKISLNLLLVAPETISFLERNLDHPIGIFIKIDAGYHRTGITASDVTAIDAILTLLSKSRRLRFRGFLAHAGNTYHASSRNEVLMIHASTCRTMTDLKGHYRQSFPDLIVSVGDTPACSVANDFSDIDEIRPGNFVFFDAMQVQLGSCTEQQVAVAMACPVVASHPDRNQVIIYGGAVHFSKDSIVSGGRQSFGSVIRLDESGWSAPFDGGIVSSLSQEHGIVTLRPDDIPRVTIGSLLGVLPVHSCLTAECMKGYVTLDGETVDHMAGAR